MERDTISSLTIKTDTGSRVLPGDKRGLPYEVWEIIFSYLPAEDLCRSAMVCKTWNDLILSLDHTKWRNLYLRSTVWRHPSWPLNLHCEPLSWRLAYKEQYLASSFWMRTNRDNTSAVTCMSVFKRNKVRKIISVGVGKEHTSLKSALAVANEYDRIEVHPGIYDEQFEMSSKIPLELVGCGELGSVILVVCIEQTALTGRVGNLVFRAPWFTNFILKNRLFETILKSGHNIGFVGEIKELFMRMFKYTHLIWTAGDWYALFEVRSGYLQVDNCIMEDGMVYVQNPGSVCMTFCTFRHATVILQYVNASIIQNCEFSQTDSAAITLEGFPKDEKNWTYRNMTSRISSVCTRVHQPERQKSGETVPKSAFSTTAISLSTATTLKKPGVKARISASKRSQSFDSESKFCEASKMDRNKRKVSVDFESVSHDIEARSCDFSVQSRGDSFQGAVGGRDNIPVRRFSHHSIDTHPSNISHHSYEADSVLFEENDDDILPGNLAQSVKNSTHSALLHLKGNHGDGVCGEKGNDHNKHEAAKFKIIQSFVSDCAKYSSAGESGEDTLAHHEESDFPLSDIEEKPYSDIKEKEATKSDSNSIFNENQGKHDTSNVVPPLDLGLLPSSSRDNQSQRSQDGQESMSSSEVLLHSASGSDVSEDEDHHGLNSDDSETTSSSEESYPVSENDSEFSSSEESVIMLTCPDRHQPRSLSALDDYADVASINSQNQSEHIDIIQDNEMKRILTEARGCFIYKCRITQSKGGVMVSLQGHAIILECEINGVGYGIRCIQNSKTVILKNEIHHCRTSGIFMRLAASGLITGNDIHSNCEAGIDIRKNADPIVQCNRIHHGKRSGIVVLGSGRGQIKHNDIYQNKEAGVYILYRGNPTVSHNQIYSGRAAGIAINEGGRGYIHAPPHGDYVQLRVCGIMYKELYGYGRNCRIRSTDYSTLFANNVITGNQWGGIDIRHGGDPVVYHNTVCNGVSDGIVIGESGRGCIENNIITGNTGCGIWIMAANQPLIHSNEIHSNRDSGISLVNRMDTTHKNETMAVDRKDTHSQHSLDFWSVVNDDQAVPKHRPVTIATVEYNKVYHNNGKGISVMFGEGVLLHSNAVHGNKGDGISINQSVPVVIKDNYVSYNSGSGVTIASHGKAEVQGNGIYDNKDYGILSQSQVDVTENDILGNGWSGVHLFNVEKATVKNNRIQTSSDYAVCLVDVQLCTVEDNMFYTKAEHTINSAKGSHCTVMNNQILPTPPTKSPETSRKNQQPLTSFCDTRWLLSDPNPRPQIDIPPKISYNPAHHVSTITRVTVPSDNCERGSKFCVIL